MRQSLERNELSIPATSLLDQISAGGLGPQSGGNPASPLTGAGIFAALLGNIEGSPENSLNIATGNPEARQDSGASLLKSVPAALTSLVANAGAATATTPFPGSGDETAIEEAVIAKPVPTSGALEAVEFDIVANVHPAEVLNLEAIRTAAQQTSAELQGTQSQARPDSATLAKLTVGQEISLQAASAQPTNTPAGAQVSGTQIVPDLRPTPSLEDASVFGSQASKSGATAAVPHANLKPSLMRAISGASVDRVDTTSVATTTDTIVPAREAAIVQNYNQQLRLADGEVRAPVQSIAVEITAHARTGIKQFEIRLDPPELGRIDVRLDMKDNGTVTTRLVVERAETLDLLQRDARFLERALSDNGLKLDEGGMRMSLKGDGAGQHAQSGAQNSGEQAENADASDVSKTLDHQLDDETGTPPPPIQRMTITGGIDIRV